MSNINIILSQILRSFILVVFSIVILKTFRFDIKIALFLYFLLYFVMKAFCLKIANYCFYTACKKQYAISLILAIMFIWCDFRYFVKFIEILCSLQRNKNIESIQKYFSDKDVNLQCVTLILYAIYQGANIPLSWFDDKYLNKNIKIDAYLYPVYKLISTPDIQSQDIKPKMLFEITWSLY